MKTILVVYSDSKTRLTKKQIGYTKRYAFNTNSDVSVGDILESPQYTTNIHVVEVFEKAFKYFNRLTGELSNENFNSNAFAIKELKCVEKESGDIVIAHKINKNG